ncbi:GGDEF domain-containing protein [Mangrovihabitans endophyticus]|uniref:GGDEF domain-containing protein n=1 Tax=Mangrovihabitans endophyticus TaxID=1751298 RepID=A0A8J3C7L2_9ACTN|nr:GGDEF domain-containing protein [Mangrovihabitans endophyticus]GGL17372.1 hypothetical protein GCM10012284_59890 [Mangrovihabitans endophyticus]
MSPTLSVIAIAAPSFLLGALTWWPHTRHLHRRLHHATRQLHHDRLTGLRNRDGLRHAYTALAGQPLLVLLIDMDRFKTVNDTYGHATGDDLLTAVAHRLDGTATVHHGFAGRIAGDEFAVLLPAAGHHPARVADLFATTITAPTTLTTDDGDMTLAPAASIGYTRTTAATGWTAALRAADIAMYHAKHAADGHPVAHRHGMAMPTPPARRRRRVRDHHTGPDTLA